MSPVKFDVSGVFKGLDRLAEQKTSLARSMAVAAGKVIRDEAKVRAPVESGRLRESIYLAYQEGKSTSDRVVYRVSWNSKLAPHGHLVEFGHWRTNAVYVGKDGQWHGSRHRIQAHWVAAHPFLRPAMEATRERAQQAMLARGRERFAELLSHPPDSGDHTDDAQ